MRISRRCSSASRPRSGRSIASLLPLLVLVGLRAGSTRPAIAAVVVAVEHLGRVRDPALVHAGAAAPRGAAARAARRPRRS